MDIYSRIKRGEFKNPLSYGEMKNKLKTALQIEEGIPSDHPKADLLFDLAWEYGHASGLSEVANHYSELSDLVKD